MSMFSGVMQPNNNESNNKFIFFCKEGQYTVFYINVKVRGVSTLLIKAHSDYFS